MSFDELMALDPSLNQTHKVFYERNDIKIKVSYERQTTVETMCLKIMLSGDLACPNEIKLEMTTENDLFFCYNFRLTDPGYGIFARDNELNTPYEQFPLILKTLIQDVGTSKGGMNFLANLELGGTGNANAILNFLADT